MDQRARTIFPQKSGRHTEHFQARKPEDRLVRYGLHKGLAAARFSGYNRVTKRTFCQPISGRFRMSLLPMAFGTECSVVKAPGKSFRRGARDGQFLERNDSLLSHIKNTALVDEIDGNYSEGLCRLPEKAKSARVAA